MDKPTRLQRIVQAARRCAQPGAWALLLLGLAAFLLLSLAAKKCYLDEKALLVGGALPTIRSTGALDACTAAFHHLLQHPPAAGSRQDVAALVLSAAAAVPAAAGLRFHQLNISTGPKAAASSGASSGRGALQCSTMHTVVRSPRGDGTEGFVLLIPLLTASPRAATLAAAAGAALAGHLRRSPWLAKDAVLVYTDAACGVVESAQAWMSAYNSAHALFDFPRAGMLQQALVLELTGQAAAPAGASSASATRPGTTSSGPAAVQGGAEIGVHGWGGQLPNLDLYYLIKRNLDMHTTLPVSLYAASVALPAAVRRGFASLSAAAAALGVASPDAAQRYAAELATLTAFALQQASGEPTGAHAAFLQHQIDAATLTLRLPAAAEDASSGSSGSSGRAQARNQVHLDAYSTLAAVEMVLRTFNNLQERLHHSTALYVLFSPDRFASIAAYLVAPACLLGAAVLQLVVERQAAAGAGNEAWHSAWRRVAAAHVAAAVAGAIAWHATGSVMPSLDSLSSNSGGSGDGGGSGSISSVVGSGGTVGSTRSAGIQPSVACLVQRMLWAAAAGAAAAEGPPALLAALALSSSSSSSSSSGGSAPASGSRRDPPKLAQRQCARAIGVAALFLQAAHLLMGSWVRCWAFLLAALPLYAASAGGHLQARCGRLASLALLLGAAAAAVRYLRPPPTLWLLRLLVPHLLLLASLLVL